MKNKIKLKRNTNTTTTSTQLTQLTEDIETLKTDISGLKYMTQKTFDLTLIVQAQLNSLMIMVQGLNKTNADN